MSLPTDRSVLWFCCLWGGCSGLLFVLEIAILAYNFEIEAVKGASETSAWDSVVDALGLVGFVLIPVLLGGWMASRISDS